MIDRFKNLILTTTVFALTGTAVVASTRIHSVEEGRIVLGKMGGISIPGQAGKITENGADFKLEDRLPTLEM